MNNVTWFHKPPFWLLLLLLSGISAGIAYRYFPRAFPLIHLTISMDRTQALEKARTLAQERHWGPVHYSQAASFVSDKQVQNFIELDGGGNTAFIEMLDKKLYQAYTWTVRHFEEHNPHELLIRFTPDGTPYGFVEKLPEDQVRPNITQQQAQALVEQQASLWHINLADYISAEISQEVKPCKRIDHVFVYERPAPTIGEGRYRLRFVVSGDTLTEITHSVKVPESFTRKYENMRSANNTIATGASIGMWVLYIFICCTFGLVYLSRRRALLWHPAVKWALVLAGLQSLVLINSMPLFWMFYNTALSKTVFLGGIITSIVTSFIFTLAFYSLIFIVAEGLTRLAFGDHLQLWKIWHQRISNSYTVAGYTIVGYALVSVMLMYVVIAYLISRKFLGWWTPSEVLLEPDVLATYAPWLKAIGLSLNAGFFEECLFRAIPLSAATLVGRYFNQEKRWLYTTFILQAIIFGAVHANYPAQPAYARLIELILPSFGFGAIYLIGGLLPGIVTHFVYDVVWFSLPIFVASGSSALINKIIIILLSLIPLGIALYRRYQAGTFTIAPENAYNGAWQPAQETPSATHTISATQYNTFSATRTTLIIGSTIVTALAGYYLLPLHNRMGTIVPNREQAITIARNTLAQHQIVLSDEWKPLTTIRNEFEPAHRFIWQQGSPALFDTLLGSYLKPPRWIIRFVNFNASLVDRAEEYILAISDTGTVQRFIHQLPESWKGAQLSETAAYAIALTAIKQQFQLEPPAIEQVSAVVHQQPARKDWTFTFKYPAIYPLEAGQARIEVKVCGDQVTDVYRYIHTPQEWTRTDEEQQSLLRLLQTMAMLALIIVVSISIGIYTFKQKFALNGKRLLYGVMSIGILKMLILCNSMPVYIATFATSISLATQVFIFLGQHLPFLLIQACGIGMIGSMLMQAPRTHTMRCSRVKSGFTAFCIGISAALIPALIKLYISTTAVPACPTIYWFYATYIPCIALLSESIFNTILRTIAIWAVIANIQFLHSPFIRTLTIVIAGILIGNLIAPVYSLTELIILDFSFAGMLTIAYYLVLRYDASLIPLFCAGSIVVPLLTNGILYPYPYALLHSIITSIVIALGAAYTYYYLNRRETLS